MTSRMFALGVLLAAACAEPSTTPGRLAAGRIGVALDVAVAPGGTALDVNIAYERQGNATPITLLDQTIAVGTDAQAVPLAVDIAPCLADPARELSGALTSSVSPGAPTCLLHITATLLDAANTVLDRAQLPAIAAAAGDQVHADLAVGTHVSYVSLAPGADHACRTLRTTGGGTTCWGSNQLGQLGSAGGDALSQQPVTGAPDFTQLVSGATHTCGLTAAGVAYCWGSNGDGELGSAPSASRATPEAVPSPVAFTQIAAGNDFTCGLAQDGAAYCWGANTYGTVGDGTRTARSAPTPVQGGRTFSKLVAAFNYACGITDGPVYCWGVFGTTVPSDAEVATWPYRLAGTVAAVGGRDVTLVSGLAAGASHACGITTDGIAYCVGKNESGQLGDGTTTSSDSAVVQAGGAGGPHYVMIAAGQSHTCGVATDGSTYCWGDNAHGQLGVGSTANQSSPQRVLTPAGVTFSSIAAGPAFTCGATGTAVYCWGQNATGQLGDGTTQDRLIPTLVK